MKQKSLAISLALLASVGVSCDSPTRMPTTGSISIILLTPGTGGMILSNTARALSATADITPVDAPQANLTLQGARVTVTGPTNKTVSSTTPNGANFDLTVTDLAPGSYTVVVEGLVASQTVYFGQTANVSVTAGGDTPASVTFASFQPALTAPTVVDTADVLHFLVSFGAVANASSYIVAVSPNSDMSAATTKTSATTSVDVTVPSEGKYFVTVKAVNSAVPTGGAPSTPKGVYAFQGVATVTVTPPNPTVAIGATQALAADAKDSDGNAVPNVQWFWVSENQSVARVSQAGVVTGVSGGTATITAVGKGTPGSTTVTVGAQLATKLAFSIQPASAVAGDPLSPAVQVEIQDAAGNRVTSSRDAVTIAFGNNAGAGTLSGTKTVNAIDGIASFSGLWINKIGTAYTLSATGTGLTAATSAGFNITPAAAAKLAFTQQPTNAQGSVAMAPVTVTITDQFDNPTAATNSVVLSLGANLWKTVFSTGGSLVGGAATPAVGGVATFNNLRVDKPAPGYTLVATSPGLTPATSNAFNVNLTISQITSGFYHMCAIATGGAYCWGYNGDNQLGSLTGQTTTDSIAALVRAGGLNFTSITAGPSHSCALTAAGAAYCWGYNGNGQLGTNNTTSSDVPVAVVGGHVFAQLDAGNNHTCGVTTAATPANGPEDRQVYCWGFNGSGQLGDNTILPKLVPTRVAEPLQSTTHASQVSAGGSHTCARAINGNVYCWGEDNIGQVGDGVVIPGGADKLVPTAVNAPGILWTSVSAGNNHSCGVTAANVARCWGAGTNGQLGDGNSVNNSSPVIVTGGLSWTNVAAANSHSCGVAGGVGYCWGYNGDGQLGDDNAPTGSNNPVTVSGGLTFIQMEAGLYSSCGRTATAVYCWGTNYYGQLGSPGSGILRKAPVQMVQ